MMQIYDIISSNITKNHYKEHNNTNYKCFLTYVHKINLREINKMKRYKKNNIIYNPILYNRLSDWMQL